MYFQLPANCFLANLASVSTQNDITVDGYISQQCLSQTTQLRINTSFCSSLQLLAYCSG